jgi:hypothetical protein
MGIDAQMFARTRANLSPEDVRRLAVELCEAFGAGEFWIGEDWPVYDDDYEKVVRKGRHALEIIGVYHQDGDDIVPDDGEMFIEAYPATRFYGEGYERGDIVFLLALARWLRSRIPNAEVWYGGDSSGVCAEPLTPEYEEQLWRRFTETGHRGYTGALSNRGGWNDAFGAGKNPVCGFCNVAMHNIGGGGGESFFSCGGCGKKSVVGADGRVTVGKKTDDIFKLAAVHRGENV